MNRYLIETSHKAEDCRHLLDMMNAQGFVRHFDWGCPSGVHTGWAVIESVNEAEARLVVPPLVRGQARIVRVSRYENGAFVQLHAD